MPYLQPLQYTLPSYGTIDLRHYICPRCDAPPPPSPAEVLAESLKHAVDAAAAGASKAAAGALIAAEGAVQLAEMINGVAERAMNQSMVISKAVAAKIRNISTEIKQKFTEGKVATGLLLERLLADADRCKSACVRISQSREAPPLTSSPPKSLNGSNYLPSSPFATIPLSSGDDSTAAVALDSRQQSIRPLAEAAESIKCLLRTAACTWSALLDHTQIVKELMYVWSEQHGRSGDYTESRNESEPQSHTFPDSNSTTHSLRSSTEGISPRNRSMDAVVHERPMDDIINVSNNAEDEFELAEELMAAAVADLTVKTLHRTFVLSKIIAGSLGSLLKRLQPFQYTVRQKHLASGYKRAQPRPKPNARANLGDEKVKASVSKNRDNFTGDDDTNYRSAEEFNHRTRRDNETAMNDEEEATFVSAAEPLRSPSAADPPTTASDLDDMSQNFSTESLDPISPGTNVDGSAVNHDDSDSVAVEAEHCSNSTGSDISRSNGLTSTLPASEGLENEEKEVEEANDATEIHDISSQ